ncbi:transmembrane protein, putative (macronuclear) [Tetrahymena thermophila SB210]|uniref:Transmembrane protein, putative n=1 Tax=Tetrahymena thermophila (strain SB210) TaxID=312017 RepID=W7X2B3_TETTS|nr:transmembrane protein, putative [Tetrahymena thermophila SB210]EWS73345.1 transmembrane protein, putative [Tetrahymena thermophila SB210]|eukprot:XP_012654117.1 transmembrane protein, putative [Tetrahymena thermophila SB210]
MKWRLFISVVIMLLFNLINIYLAICAFTQGYYWYSFSVALVYFLERGIDHSEQSFFEIIFLEIINFLRLNTIVSDQDIREIKLGSVYLMTFINTFYYLTEYKMVKLNAIGQVHIFISIELFILILDSIYIPIIQGGDEGFKFKAILYSLFGHLAYYTSLKCIFNMDDSYGNNLAWYLIVLIVLNIFASLLLYKEKINSIFHKFTQVLVGFLSNYQWMISSKYKKYKIYNRDSFVINMSLFNQISLFLLIIFNSNLDQLVFTFFHTSNVNQQANQIQKQQVKSVSIFHHNHNQILSQDFQNYNFNLNQKPNINEDVQYNYYHQIFLLEAIIASFLYLLLGLKQIFDEIFIKIQLIINEDKDYIEAAQFFLKQSHIITRKKYYITTLYQSYDFKENHNIKDQLKYLVQYTLPQYTNICSYCKLQLSISKFMKGKEKFVKIKCGKYSEVNRNFQCTCLYSIQIFCNQDYIHRYNSYMLYKDYYINYLPFIYFYRYFNGQIFTDFTTQIENILERAGRSSKYKCYSLQITAYYVQIKNLIPLQPFFVLYDLYIDN